MPAENDGTLSTEAQIIRDETVPKANTANRIGVHMLNMISSKVNWTQVDTDVTLAADSDQRTVSQKAIKAYVDASGGAVGFKKYSIYVSQSGSGAPTAAIKGNTLSGTPVLTRATTGEYLITLSGAFTVNKTFIANGLRLLPFSGTDFLQIQILWVSANEISITTTVGPNGAGSAADSQLSGTDIDITVFD